MTSSTTGGSAFPHEVTNPMAHGSSGMTLLDYFAGRAIAGLAPRLEPGVYYASCLAKEAYDIATEMLAEKRRRESPPEIPAITNTP